MHNFLTLFYPVVQSNDPAEIERLLAIKAGDPFYVVPGWNDETKEAVAGQVGHFERIGMERALITHLLDKAEKLKEILLGQSPPPAGEIVPAYIEAVADATVYAGQPAHRVVDMFARELWSRVNEIGNQLIEYSKLREAMYEEKELGPIRIMVITSPRFYRYLDIHQYRLDEPEQLMVGRCFDTRIENKLLIAIGRTQKKTDKAEPYTYGTLKYTPKTTFEGVKPMRGYTGHQLHYEFVDNIPVLGQLEVQGLSTVFHPLNHSSVNMIGNPL